MRLTSFKRGLVYSSLALGCFGLGSVVAPVHAGTITYVTPAGATIPAGPVDASAMFTTSANTLTIVLTNLLANPKDVGQLLSDLSFTLGNGGSLTGSTQTAASSSEITVAGDGSFTGPTPISGVATVGWPFTVNSSTSGTLDVLSGPGHAGPAHTIIGPPGPGGTYSDANNSIAGNGPHNPFLFESATFTITGAGITADTTITSATFSFGTTSGVTVGGVPGFVPEPSSLVLALCGLGVVGLAGSYRSRRRSTVDA
jgi:hypothetical protein